MPVLTGALLGSAGVEAGSAAIDSSYATSTRATWHPGPDPYWQPAHGRCDRVHRLPLAVSTGLGWAHAQVTITATLPAHFPGTVVFSEDGQRLGLRRVQGSRRVTLTTTAFGAGVHTVSARFTVRRHRGCRLFGSVRFGLREAPGPGQVDVQSIVATVPPGPIIVSMPYDPSWISYDPHWVAEQLAAPQVWWVPHGRRGSAWLGAIVVTDVQGGDQAWELSSRLTRTPPPSTGAPEGCTLTVTIA